MPEPIDINSLSNDPDFKNLPQGEQHKFLKSAIPEYSQLSGEEQGKFLNHVSGRTPATPAGLPPGTNLPGFPAPPNVIQQRIDQDQGRGDTSDKIQNQVNTQNEFIRQAGKNVMDTASAVKSGAKKWWNMSPSDKVGSVVMSPLAAAIGAGENVGHSATRLTQGHPVDAASQLMGGNPDKADELDRQGNHGAADWERWGKPITMAAVSELGARSLTGLQDLVAGPAEGAQANDAFASWISGGVKHGTPQDTAAAVRPLFKQAAANVGLKDEGALARSFTGDTPTRGPGMTADKNGIRKTVSGMKKGLQVADEAVRLADQPMQAVVEQAKNDVISDDVRKNIVSGLQAKGAAAEQVGNDSLASAYKKLAEKVGEKKTYGELNELKQNANQQIEGVGTKGSPSEQIASAVKPVAAWQDLGGLIRENMYPALQERYVPRPGQPGYFDLKAMGQREAQVLDARDGIYKGHDEAAKLDAPRGAQTAKEKASEGSMYKTHVAKRLLGIEPSPAGKFNTLMRRGIGEIGNGGTPESVSVVPKTMQPRLPAPPGWAPFEVPIPGQPESATDMTNGLTKEYVGDRDVPNPNYSPMSGPSWVQQQQELGSTAHTIPDRVRGAQSDARMRADEVGMGHTPGSGKTGMPSPPVRSFTGPETISEANFQTKMGAIESAPGSTRGTRGVFKTSDPAKAQDALDAMDEHVRATDAHIQATDRQINSPAFKKLEPSEQTRIRKAQDVAKQAQYETRESAEKLRKQISAHHKVQNMQRPAEFEVHYDSGTPAKLKGRKTGIVRRVATYGGRAIAQGRSQNPLLPPPPTGETDEEEEQEIDDNEQQ